MKETVIAIVGPTAVGKTNLSIKIAKKLQAEIISGDSMQVYEGMDIGTDKISSNETAGIKHHMIDILKPSETFSVADFQKKARQYIENIHSKNKIPIIVGGSGLYIEAILYDYQFSDRKRNEELTKKLENRAKTEGIDVLYRELNEIDPIQAEKIHPNNVRRVVRALEVYYETGKTMSDTHKNQRRNALYNHIIIGLEMERHLLYNRINQRVDDMIQEGLVNEVKSIYDTYGKDIQAMKAIGYKEIIPFIEGSLDLDRCIELLKRNSRRYAKRQMTWFKNKMDVIWYAIDEQTNEANLNNIYKEIKSKIDV